MPNTPCLLSCGMTALCKGKYADARHVETARALFNVVGKTVVVDEKHMDAVTGLSASGPAYIYIILESLAEAGVKVGLDRKSTRLNSSHGYISYAVFCLKKKKKQNV